MSLFTGETFGLIVTVVALVLTFWSTALIEFGWGSVALKRGVIAVNAAVFVAWLAMVAARFVVVG